MANRKVAPILEDVCWFCKQPADTDSWMGLGLLKVTKAAVFRSDPLDNRSHRIKYHECCAVYSQGPTHFPPEGPTDKDVLDLFTHGEKAAGIGLKCGLCGLRGATSGCYYHDLLSNGGREHCQSFYHYPCARVCALRGEVTFTHDGNHLSCNDPEHKQGLPPLREQQGEFLGMWMEGVGGWNKQLRPEAESWWRENREQELVRFRERWAELLDMQPARERAEQEAHNKKARMKERARKASLDDPSFNPKRKHTTPAAAAAAAAQPIGLARPRPKRHCQRQRQQQQTHTAAHAPAVMDEGTYETGQEAELLLLAAALASAHGAAGSPHVQDDGEGDLAPMDMDAAPEAVQAAQAAQAVQAGQAVQAVQAVQAARAVQAVQAVQADADVSHDSSSPPASPDLTPEGFGQQGEGHSSPGGAAATAAAAQDLEGHVAAAAAAGGAGGGGAAGLQPGSHTCSIAANGAATDEAAAGPLTLDLSSLDLHAIFLEAQRDFGRWDFLLRDNEPRVRQPGANEALLPDGCAQTGAGGAGGTGARRGTGLEGALAALPSKWSLFPGSFLEAVQMVGKLAVQLGDYNRGAGPGNEGNAPAADNNSLLLLNRGAGTQGCNASPGDNNRGAGTQGCNISPVGNNNMGAAPAACNNVQADNNGGAGTQGCDISPRVSASGASGSAAAAAGATAAHTGSLAGGSVANAGEAAAAAAPHAAAATAAAAGGGDGPHANAAAAAALARAVAAGSARLLQQDEPRRSCAGVEGSLGGAGSPGEAAMEVDVQQQQQPMEGPGLAPSTDKRRVSVCSAQTHTLVGTRSPGVVQDGAAEMDGPAGLGPCSNGGVAHDGAAEMEGPAGLGHSDSDEATAAGDALCLLAGGDPAGMDVDPQETPLEDSAAAPAAAAALCAAAFAAQEAAAGQGAAAAATACGDPAGSGAGPEQPEQTRSRAFLRELLEQAGYNPQAEGQNTQAGQNTHPGQVGQPEGAAAATISPRLLNQQKRRQRQQQQQQRQQPQQQTRPAARGKKQKLSEPEPASDWCSAWQVEPDPRRQKAAAVAAAVAALRTGLSRSNITTRQQQQQQQRQWQQQQQQQPQQQQQQQQQQRQQQQTQQPQQQQQLQQPQQQPQPQQPQQQQQQQQWQQRATQLQVQAMLQQWHNRYLAAAAVAAARLGVSNSIIMGNAPGVRQDLGAGLNATRAALAAASAAAAAAAASASACAPAAAAGTVSGTGFLGMGNAAQQPMQPVQPAALAAAVAAAARTVSGAGFLGIVPGSAAAQQMQPVRPAALAAAVAAAARTVSGAGSLGMGSTAAQQMQPLSQAAAAAAAGPMRAQWGTQGIAPLTWTTTNRSVTTPHIPLPSAAQPVGNNTQPLLGFASSVEQQGGAVGIQHSLRQPQGIVASSVAQQQRAVQSPVQGAAIGVQQSAVQSPVAAPVSSPQAVQTPVVPAAAAAAAAAASVATAHPHVLLLCDAADEQQGLSQLLKQGQQPQQQQQQQQQRPAPTKVCPAPAAGVFKCTAGAVMGPGGRLQFDKILKAVNLNVLVRTGRKQLSVVTNEQQLYA